MERHPLIRKITLFSVEKDLETTAQFMQFIQQAQSFQYFASHWASRTTILPLTDSTKTHHHLTVHRAKAWRGTPFEVLWQKSTNVRS